MLLARRNLFQDTTTTPTSYRPTIHFNDRWILSYSGCPSADANATASYRVHFGNGVARSASISWRAWSFSPASISKRWR